MRDLLRVGLSLVFWATALLSPSYAAAQATSDRFALEWQRSTEARACASAESIERMLERTTGSQLVERATANIFLRCHVDREVDQARWIARVQIVTVAGAVLGERRIVEASPLCASITPAVLLVLAMVVAPSQTVDTLPPSVRAEIAEQARAETAAPAVAAPEVLPRVEPIATIPTDGRVTLAHKRLTLAASDPSRRGPQLGMALRIGVELAPSVTVGLSAAFDLPIVDPWRLLTSATYWEHSSVPVSGPHTLGGGVRFETGAADLLLGRLIAMSPKFSATPGLGVTFAYRSTQAEALAYRLDRTRVYAGPTAALVLDYQFARHWFFDARLGLVMLLPRHRFFYSEFEGGSKVLFSPNLFAGWLSIGMSKEL